PDEKTMIHQFITGVRPPYRGRGLGKWLKAANLLRVRREFPQVTVVLTDNATTNEAMLSINKRLGFEKYREEENFQITLEGLRAYLDA
ncbi:MAG: GNAT family N-acetyltransferase, partial [Planctomycetota bacterium]